MPARSSDRSSPFGAVSGQVAQSEAAQRAALASYELAVQSAFADVDNALVAYLKTGEQLEAQKRLVSALGEYERLAKLQYDAGYIPYSTVLQAQQALFPAELGLAELRAAALEASTNIYKAMGGGWIDEADKLSGKCSDCHCRARCHTPLVLTLALLQHSITLILAPYSQKCDRV